MHPARRPDRVLVLDIETVRDEQRTPSTVPHDAFPKALFHRVVAISYVVAQIEIRSDGSERYTVERCKSGGAEGWSEAELLAGLWTYFRSGNFRVVTWNGARFDMAVLRLRAMLHGISASEWYKRGDKWNSYRSRFSEDYHCDVMQCLSDNGATQALGLDEAAHALGLPGKIGGNGKLVSDLITEGRIQDVNAYCECDVLNTYCLYLRWAHHSGRCSPEDHDESARQLVSYLGCNQGGAPHFGSFLDGWTRRYLASCPPKPNMFKSPHETSGPLRGAALQG